MTETCKGINYEFKRDKQLSNEQLHMHKELQLQKAILTKRLESLKDFNNSPKKVAISTKSTPKSSPSKLPELIISSSKNMNRQLKNVYLT